MNFKLIFLLFFMTLSANMVFASFPVERHVKTTVSTISANSDEDELYMPKMGSEKSQGVALILALVLGLLAAHRWYLGSPWLLNIFYIWTLGGLGIWLLIDIIRISIGDMGPANGRYKKEFF